MPSIISTPSKGIVRDENNAYQFAYFETQHERPTQEDALAWYTVPENLLQSLTPNEIAERLWTTCKELDEQAKKLPEEAGTTASITVFDGKDNLITATLGDSVAFIVAYGKEGEVISAARLNSILHHPGLPSESKRILEAGGEILKNAISGSLSVSRAIGDYDITGADKQKLAISDAAIDIASINQLLQDEEEPISKIQIITTCDGFTDGTQGNDIQSQVFYLMSCLAKMDKPGLKTESEIAEFLANCAIKSGSKDNISIAVQTLQYNVPIFLALYDGHGGKAASHYAALHGADIFFEQCQLSKNDYEKQSLRVNENYREENEKAVNFLASSSSCFLEKISLRSEKRISKEESLKDEFKSAFSLSVVDDSVKGRSKGFNPEFFGGSAKNNIENKKSDVGSQFVMSN